MNKSLRLALALLVGTTITCVTELILLAYRNHPPVWVGRIFDVLTLPAGAVCSVLLNRGSEYTSLLLLGVATDVIFYSALAWFLLGRPWRRLLSSRRT